MLKRTFEDFLKEVHFKIFIQVLDDDLVEDFDNWLENLDGEEYIKWGEFYGREQYLAGQGSILEDKEDDN